MRAYSKVWMLAETEAHLILMQCKPKRRGCLYDKKKRGSGGRCVKFARGMLPGGTRMALVGNEKAKAMPKEYRQTTLSVTERSMVRTSDKTNAAARRKVILAKQAARRTSAQKMPSAESSTACKVSSAVPTAVTVAKTETLARETGWYVGLKLHRSEKAPPCSFEGVVPRLAGKARKENETPSTPYEARVGIKSLGFYGTALEAGVAYAHERLPHRASGGMLIKDNRWPTGYKFVYRKVNRATGLKLFYMRSHTPLGRHNKDGHTVRGGFKSPVQAAVAYVRFRDAGDGDSSDPDEDFRRSDGAGVEWSDDKSADSSEELQEDGQQADDEAEVEVEEEVETSWEENLGLLPLANCVPTKLAAKQISVRPAAANMPCERNLNCELGCTHRKKRSPCELSGAANLAAGNILMPVVPLTRAARKVDSAAAGLHSSEQACFSDYEAVVVPLPPATASLSPSGANKPLGAAARPSISTATRSCVIASTLRSLAGPQLKPVSLPVILQTGATPWCQTPVFPVTEMVPATVTTHPRLSIGSERHGSLVEGTPYGLAQQVADVREKLQLCTVLGLCNSVRQANALMGYECTEGGHGSPVNFLPLPQQVRRLMDGLGLE